MKRCPNCSTTFDDPAWLCPDCKWSPPRGEGYLSFTDHVAGANEAYDPEWYEELASLEGGNFWFLARNRLIRWLAARYCAADASYLELGCGTGFVLQMLCKSFPGWRTEASEYHAEGLAFAASRNEKTSFYQMDARTIPFRSQYDVIGAFDVVEHIEEDQLVLSEVCAALVDGGVFLMSVPQHMFLWSRYDELGGHFRRYSMRELHEKLKTAGFEIVESTSFNSILLPLMLLSRIGKRDATKEVDVLDELRMGRTMNKILGAFLYLEFVAIKLGVRLPLGGSRIIVARKVR